MYMPSLLQAYIKASPVPLVHYQRSDMKLLYMLLKEYVNGGKIDICKRVKNKQNAS